jgi:hypothetical protein
LADPAHDAQNGELRKGGAAAGRSARSATTIQFEQSFRKAVMDGREMTLWVDIVEKGLVLFGEQ